MTSCTDNLSATLVKNSRGSTNNEDNLRLALLVSRIEIEEIYQTRKLANLADLFRKRVVQTLLSEFITSN